jgi:hypothetical protein
MVRPATETTIRAVLGSIVMGWSGPGTLAAFADIPKLP